MKRHGEDVTATLYTQSGAFPFKYTPSDEDCLYMDIALVEARKAAEAGDSPIGAVLVHLEGGIFPAQATEFRDEDLQGHAEQNAYKAAKEEVGRDLGECVLYTSAEPCFACAYMLDKGALGTLHVAAMRSDAPDFFRRKNVIKKVFGDTTRNLTVVTGLRKAKALDLLIENNKQH